MTVRLALLHPEVARRPCSECRKWMYTADGELMKSGDGRPRPRAPGDPTPCWKCPKVPEDAPTRTSHHAVEPSERSRVVWRHYRECKATGRFPDDDLVRANAAVIAGIEEAVERLRLDRVYVLLGGKL